MLFKLFLIFEQRKYMAEIVIPQQNWDRIKIKIKRKYNHLQDSDLTYQQGKENELIEFLQLLLHRDRNYVVFMLRKMQLNIDNNQL